MQSTKMQETPHVTLKIWGKWHTYDSWNKKAERELCSTLAGGADWKVVVESREDTGILSPRRRIQSRARDEAWSLRAFV